MSKEASAFADYDTIWGDNYGGAGVYKYLFTNPPAYMPLFQDEKNSNQYPKWSADGQKIPLNSTNSGNWAIWSMDADGSGRAEIVNGKYGLPQESFDCSRCQRFDVLQ